MTLIPYHRRLARETRNSRGASELAQFIPAIYVLFLLITLPVLDVLTLFIAGTTQYLVTNDIAAKAATQSDFTSALNTVANEASQFQTTGLAGFVQMVRAGGYIGCGHDLNVLATDIASGAVTSSGANQPLNQPINSQTKMYELSVQSLYSISPLISLAPVPLLGNIPGLRRTADIVLYS